MRVVYKAPGQPAEPREVPDSGREQLAALQALVGGWLESWLVADSVVLLFDEDGRRKALVPNIKLARMSPVLRGPVVIVGSRGPNMVELRAELSQAWAKHLDRAAVENQVDRLTGRAPG